MAAHATVVKRAARACESALALAGVRVLVVGSVAYGGVRPASDLDLLVVSYRGRKWHEVRSIAAEAARPFGIPVDVIFADTLPPAIRRTMVKDARRASDLSTTLVHKRPIMVHSRHAAGLFSARCTVLQDPAAVARSAVYRRRAGGAFLR
ncbi:MAG: nucleotidyltransferase family protein [Burkholderiales bacterium]